MENAPVEVGLCEFGSSLDRSTEVDALFLTVRSYEVERRLV